ncbi:assimilatory sulfite reductase (NADPH) flavoprotein subunit [Saccharicrinis sp. GN24d3]|uniref:assimilatory sulfite reductase (NADPH) flavoprotein subunit n=1 Tax=Saccharicrinis sp. GN24d3 TaxID=3458416 RepID=UPI004036E4ED
MIDAISKIFSQEQITQAKQLYEGLTDEQRFWLSGYLAGLNQTGGFLNGALQKNGSAAHGTNGTPNVAVANKLSIIYGTHTGNSKLIAEKFSALAEAKGIEVSLCSMPEYKNRKLKEEKNLLVIVSTHGEGDPPASAEDFYSYIFGKKAPKVNDLNFAVIALGDSSYINYCQTGRDIFNQLKTLGSTDVHELIELDIDFKEQLGQILPNLANKFASINGSAVNIATTAANLDFDNDKWVEVEVLDKTLLNGKGSNKKTYHIELDIEDTGISYLPGDALEIQADNDDKLVLAILLKLNIKESEVINIDGNQINVKEALKTKYEITTITAPVLKKYAEFAKNDKLSAILEDTSKLADFLYGLDFLDLLTDFPAPLKATDLPTLLRKLPARVYSISSSYDYNPDEVHVTVSAVKYHLNNREHLGVCSSFLADRINIGDHVSVRVKKNEGFRLPANDAKLIMVGPGTGIAPFRSFLQQRENDEASGDNWLFFGDQHFETDFLYQTEMLHLRKKGLLSDIDVAFSRDQEDKIYVQHRLQEKGEKVYKWLEEGAYFYLCGDMRNMAKDVKAELLNIIEQHGSKTKEEANAYLKNLTAEKRFQEDVY